MGFKHERLGPRLVEAARSGERFRDAHAFLGGTGAVGGTAVLEMLSMYEEMLAVGTPADDDVPILVATGTTADEIAAFTRRLFRFVESRFGAEHLPRRVRRGYLTGSGVFVALERFEVSALPGLRRLSVTPREERAGVVAELLASLGASPDDGPIALRALAKAVAEARPFSAFLERYRDQHLTPNGTAAYRSVLVGIPIPSLIAYHQDEMRFALEQIPGLGTEAVEELQERFVEALGADMAGLREVGLAETVILAHTTGVGGMHDEAPGGGPPSIRLGFAHAGLDTRLGEKAKFADLLRDRYAALGVKVLVTAAAIGIDEVRVREPIPLHRTIRQQLFDAEVEVFPGSKASQPAESRASQMAGRPLPARQTIRSFPPVTVEWDQRDSGPVRFDRGQEVVPSYVIRSGENGFFTVANADALYRTMRVASAGELGLIVATVGLLGDDRISPWFPEGVCYYDETDNARQVLEFLAQPALLGAQLSGLEPLALQDLGSAKHQAEMHTLSLLILLQRLRTLDVDAIDPYVEMERFDARAFLEQHSRALTFEEFAAWEFERLAADLATLAGADAPEDLLALTPPREYGLFPRRREALQAVLEQVLRAVWNVTSIGTPVLLEREGRTVLRIGYYVAPLDLLVTDRMSVRRDLEARARASGNAYEDVRDYHAAVGGFVDLRPHAIVCSARSDEEDLRNRVARFTDLDSLREHLFSLEPYSFFATTGLLAVWHRLRSLYRLLHEAVIELGSMQGWWWQMPRDAAGHVLVVPGVVESLRMVSEGLEKTTGTERLDGIWGYERRPPVERAERIPGIGTGDG